MEPSNENAEGKQEPVAPAHLPEPDGFGTPEAEFGEAAAIAERAGNEIATNFHALGPRQKRRLVTAFRRQLIPPGKPGRKRSKEITAAYADYKAGMRGLALYRKHIPRFERMSVWQRKVKTRALMDSIGARKRREVRRRAQQTEAAGAPIAEEISV